MVSNIAVTITGNRAAASAYLLVLISKAQSPADAVEYWHRAGERALQRSAHLEAESHLRRGVEVINWEIKGRGESQKAGTMPGQLSEAIV